MAVGLPSLPMLAWMLFCSRVSWFTARSFSTVMSAIFATSAACTISRWLTYLPLFGRSTIWFSAAASCRMPRFSSSIFRPSRAFCTRFSATRFAMAISSSRCWRATSAASAFRCACFCCQASAFRWFSSSHSMISFSCTIRLYSALSARRCSSRTCRARSAFSPRSCRTSSLASSRICCSSVRIRLRSAFHSRS